MVRSRSQKKSTSTTIIFHAMLLLTIVFIYLIFNVSQFDEVVGADAMDYAQIARHVYRGEGFTTSFIKPLSLVYNQSIENHPDLTYPPLHILWTSGMMRLLGPNDKAVAHSSGLAFLLAIPVVYLLALRLFDRRAALLASVLYATNTAYLVYSISGLEASLLSLFVTLILLLLYQVAADQRREGLWVILAGIVMGLLYLTKYIWGLAAIPILIYLWTIRENRRMVRALVFIGLALIVASPWLVRNYRLTGNPCFTLRSMEALGQTKRFPGNSVYRTCDKNIQSFAKFAVTNPRAILDKLRSGMLVFYGSITGIAGIYTTSLFLVAMLVVLGDKLFERWRLLLYSLIVIIAVGLSFLIAAPRLLMPLGPAALVIATGFFWRLLDDRIEPLPIMRQARARNFCIGLLLLLHIIPLATRVMPKRMLDRQANDPVRSAAIQLNDRTQGVIITDIPWRIAWAADRDAVWLPQSVTDLRKCEQLVGRFQWLMLSPMIMRMASTEKLELWSEVWARSLRADTQFEDFVVEARLSSGRWVLMKRRPVAENIPSGAATTP